MHQHQPTIAECCRRYRVQRLEVFGSGEKLISSSKAAMPIFLDVSRNTHGVQVSPPGDSQGGRCAYRDVGKGREHDCMDRFLLHAKSAFPTSLWVEVEQRRSSCRGAEAFPALPKASECRKRLSCAKARTGLLVPCGYSGLH